MGVSRPMRKKVERETEAPRSILIVSMSPLGYSLARLLRSRAGLRFTQPVQFTPSTKPASSRLPRLIEYKHNFSCTPQGGACGRYGNWSGSGRDLAGCQRWRHDDDPGHFGGSCRADG